MVRENTYGNCRKTEHFDYSGTSNSGHLLLIGGDRGGNVFFDFPKKQITSILPQIT